MLTRSAEKWREAKENDIALALNDIPCEQIAKMFVQPFNRQRGAPPAKVDQAWGPWGLQLAGGYTERGVLEQYRRLQSRFPLVLGDRKPLVLRSSTASRGAATWYLVRVAEATRESANKLCARLEAAGGACIVYRNSSDQK
jgi:SPOR domain